MSYGWCSVFPLESEEFRARFRQREFPCTFRVPTGDHVLRVPTERPRTRGGTNISQTNVRDHLYTHTVCPREMYFRRDSVICFLRPGLLKTITVVAFRAPPNRGTARGVRETRRSFRSPDDSGFIVIRCPCRLPRGVTIALISGGCSRVSGENVRDVRGHPGGDRVRVNCGGVPSKPMGRNPERLLCLRVKRPFRF